MESDENLTEQLRLRCTPADKAAIQEAAKKDGRTPSNWMLWVLRKAIRESEKPKK